jgi:hypothetical protein
LLWLFGNGVLRSICTDWPQTLTILISASQVARITGMSHWYVVVTTGLFLSVRQNSQNLLEFSIRCMMDLFPSCRFKGMASF